MNVFNPAPSITPAVPQVLTITLTDEGNAAKFTAVWVYLGNAPYDGITGAYLGVILGGPTANHSAFLYSVAGTNPAIQSSLIGQPVYLVTPNCKVFAQLVTVSYAMPGQCVIKIPFEADMPHVVKIQALDRSQPSNAQPVTTFSY